MENLRYIRKIRRLSMKRLGELVGVSESTISLYENGKRQPDHEMLKKLSAVLDVSVDFLLGIESPITLNKKIEFLMRCNGLSNRRVAKSLNINDETVQGWLDGVISPTTQQIVSLANLFGVASDYLLYDCNYVPSQFRNLSDKEWAVLDIYQETDGDLLKPCSFYSEEDKEDVFPILKKIKAAQNGLPLSQELQDLLTVASDLSDEDLQKAREYVELLKLKHNS